MLPPTSRLSVLVPANLNLRRIEGNNEDLSQTFRAPRQEERASTCSVSAAAGSCCSLVFGLCRSCKRRWWPLDSAETSAAGDLNRPAQWDPQLTYSTTLAATGGTGPYSWSVTKGSLPAGLTISTSGVISGTPTQAGTSAFTVQVTDSSSPAGTASANLSITVAAAAQSPSITTTSLPNATTGTAYSATLQASGGTTPYNWTLSAGTLPAGLTLAASTGVISGTPTTAGTASFTVQVTDSASNTATKALSIAVAAAQPPSVATTSLPAATTGTVYSATLQASGGTTPYSWSLTAGALPAGLTLVTSTGVISGTPTATGTSSFTLQVTDAANNTGTRALSITVAAAAQPPSVTTTSLPAGITDTAYSTTLHATGGTTPYSWSVSVGTLPAGLTLVASTGVISGTPTTAGTFSFTVEVKDAANSTGTKALSIVIAAQPPTVTTTSLPGASTGTAYSTTLQASEGTTPYTWSISTGTLPAGLSLAASTGVISGAPTTAGTVSFTVQVKDAANNTATKALSILVATTAQPPLVTTHLTAGCHQRHGILSNDPSQWRNDAVQLERQHGSFTRRIESRRFDRWYLWDADHRRYRLVYSSG